MSFWGVINFLILAAGVVYAVRKMVKPMLVSKHDTIQKAVDEAEKLRRAVEQMMKDYQTKLSNMDSEIKNILEEAKREGEKEKTRILERARRMAEKIREDARLAAEKERIRLERELEKETLKNAVAKAAELLREKVGEREHRAFTAELIEQLEHGNGQRS